MSISGSTNKDGTNFYYFSSLFTFCI